MDPAQANSWMPLSTLFRRAKSQKTSTYLVLLSLAVPMRENHLLSMRYWVQSEISLRIKQARQEIVLTRSITNTALSLFLSIRQESVKNRRSKKISSFIRSCVRCAPSNILTFVWCCLTPPEPLTVKLKTSFGWQLGIIKA